MICDKNHIKKYICEWIADQAKQLYKESLIVGVSGGINSGLVAELCEQTAIRTILIHLSFNETDKQIKANLPVTTINITSNSIVDEIGTPDEIEIFRHGLMASYLSFYASKHNGLIVGTVNRTKGHLVRHFNKVGDGSADIFPIADLMYDDVWDLSKYANKLEPIPPIADLHPQKINHQNRLGLNYTEIDWADYENMKNDILNNPYPEKYKFWFKYFVKQKEIISRVHQYNTNTLHKKITAPICELRHLNWAIR